MVFHQPLTLIGLRITREQHRELAELHADHDGVVVFLARALIIDRALGQDDEVHAIDGDRVGAEGLGLNPTLRQHCADRVVGGAIRAVSQVADVPELKVSRVRVSPDGQWVGFFADGELKKIRLDGATGSTIR